MTVLWNSFLSMFYKPEPGQLTLKLSSVILIGIGKEKMVSEHLYLF